MSVTVVAAPVTSAWASKINWTQIVSMAAMLGTVVTGGSLNITPGEQTAVVVAVGVLTNVVTVVLRTFFAPSVVAGSAEQLPVVSAGIASPAKLKP